MPTVAEPLSPERTDKIAQCVKEFIEAKPLSVDDSEDVLRARLFGLGLRGQDLNSEVNLAKWTRFERRQRTTRTPCPRGGWCPYGGCCPDCVSKENQ